MNIEYDEYEEHLEDEFDTDVDLVSPFRWTSCIISQLLFLVIIFYNLSVSDYNLLCNFYLIYGFVVFITWTFWETPTSKFCFLQNMAISMLGGLFWGVYYGIFLPFNSLAKFWNKLPDTDSKN